MREKNYRLVNNMRVGIDLRSRNLEYSAGAEVVLWNTLPHLFSFSQHHFVFFIDECDGKKLLQELRTYKQQYRNVEIVVSRVSNVLSRRVSNVFHKAPSDWVVNGIDVVWVPWIASLSGRGNIPLVQSLYDVSWKRFSSMSSWSTRFRNILKAPGRGAMCASSIVVPFSSVSRDVEQYFKISQSRISVISLGAPVFQKFSEQERGVFDRYSLPSSYILCVLHYGWQDTIESVMHAYAGLQRENRCEYPLVLVTSFHDFPKHVLRCIKKLHLTSSVYLFRSFPEEYWQLLYERAVMFVNSAIHDGGVHSVMRAMTYGVPVICGNTGSLPEISNDAAILVDTGRANDIALAMDQLLQSDDLWYEYQRRGMIQAQKYSWSESAEKLLEVFVRRVEE